MYLSPESARRVTVRMSESAFASVSAANVFFHGQDMEVQQLMNDNHRGAMRIEATVLCALLALLLSAHANTAAPTSSEILGRLESLEARQAALESEVARKDEQIAALRRALNAMRDPDVIVEETIVPQDEDIGSTPTTCRRGNR